MQARFEANSAHSSLLFWLSGSVGVSMIGLGIIWPLVPQYASLLGAKGLEIGLIIASFNIARSIANPFVGKLSDSRSHKRLIVLGLLLCTLASMLYLVASNVVMLVGVRLFHGFASAFVLPVALSLTASIAPEEQLGKYMGTLNMAVMFGMGTGPIIGGILNDALGMHFVFIVMSAIALLTCIGVFIAVPSTGSPRSAVSRNRLESKKGLMWHRPVQGLLLLRFFGSLGQGAVYTFLPVLAFQMGLKSSEVGILLTTNILIIAALQRPVGEATDRCNPVPLMVFSAGFSGLAVALMPFYQSFYAILFLNILMALANSIALPTGYVIAGYTGKKFGMGGIMGGLDTARTLGFMVSPIISGCIFDFLGIAPVFYIGGIVIVVASIVSYRLLRHWTKENYKDEALDS